MRLSRRDISKFAQTEENLSNVGSSNVAVEPSSAYVSKAIDLLKSNTPEVLNNITDIKTVLDKDVYGEYNSQFPHTVFINLGKIERDVRAKLGGEAEEEIVRQIAIVIGHESGHQHAYTQSQTTSEAPAEQKEKEVTERIDRD